MNNEYTIYFFYDTSKKLLYIGKTTKLRERVGQHIYAPLVEKEPWKKEIDLDDILVYHCANKCDMDIYETYFINKYKPKYNKDKAYGVRASFKLPYLEGIKYMYNPATMYTEQFLKYIDLRDSEELNLELIEKYEIDFPIFKKHYENKKRKEWAIDGRELLLGFNSLKEKTRIHFMEVNSEHLKLYPIKWDEKKKLVVYR